MGPLNGFRIVEMAGLGPAPFAGMMLSDMGAEIIRIKRPNKSDVAMHQNSSHDFMSRGRRSVIIDLKKPEGTEIALSLIAQADGLIEGFRPGVMERLGLGPEICLEKNNKLIYCRMTGWGQSGPLASKAGHDINYIALTGALHSIGHKSDPPPPPLNLIGDFGGGGMFLAFGMVCALLETTKSGKGQVLDVAMVDGVTTLMAMFHGLLAQGAWQDKRNSNFLDGASHFYNTYETLDGKFIAVGAIEPKFYEALLKTLNVEDDASLKIQMDPSNWSKQKKKFASIFKTKTRDEWCKVMENSDVCFAPVLSIEESSHHPHIKSRNTIVKNSKGENFPSPAPRFSRTPAQPQDAANPHEQEIYRILYDWGFEKSQIDRLISSQIIFNNS